MTKRVYQAPVVEEIGSVQDLTSQVGKVSGSGDCFPGSEDILSPCTED